MNMKQLKISLLDSLLPIVAIHGWSERSINMACEQYSHPFIALFGISTNPVHEMIECFSQALDEQMLAMEQSKKFIEARTNEKIIMLIMKRFQYMNLHKAACKKTLMQLLLPPNIIFMERLLFSTISKIWYACGDRSVDHNYYSKRIILASIYKITYCYWAQDQSDQNHATQIFLQDKIYKITRKGWIKNAVSRIFPLFKNTKSV